jgi:O-antigen ligase
MYYSLMYPDDLYNEDDTTTTTTTTTQDADSTTSTTTPSTTTPTTRPTRPPVPEINLDRGDVDEDVSNNRFQIWSDCLKLVKEAPLFGTGPRTHLAFAKDHFDDMYIVEKGYTVHNGYLALFVSTGGIGGILMLSWLICVVVHVLGYLIRRFQSRDQYYWPVFICTTVLVMEAISAFPFMALFFCNQITDILFWMTLGFTFTFIYKSEPERYQKPSFIGKILNGIFGGIRSFFTKKSA